MKNYDPLVERTAINLACYAGADPNRWQSFSRSAQDVILTVEKSVLERNMRLDTSEANFVVMLDALKKARNELKDCRDQWGMQRRWADNAESIVKECDLILKKIGVSYA